MHDSTDSSKIKLETEAKPRVLIVGAGAVGQVYAYALQKGGANTSVFVKEKHAKSCRDGFVLYHLNRKSKATSPIQFQAAQVLTTLGEVASQKWDFVLLCIPTSGLQGGWLEGFIQAAIPATGQASGDTVIVSFIPGIEPHEKLKKLIPQKNLSRGVISLISYNAPLKNEPFPLPGTAYWIPPFQPTPITGPKEKLKTLISVFRKGGIRACYQNETSVARIAFADGLLTVFVAALKYSSWSFQNLKKPENLKLLLSACREATLVISRRLDQKPPLAFSLLSTTSLKLILSAGPSIFPFDIETLLHHHFVKVDLQMKELLSSCIEDGLRLGLSVKTLKSLQ